MNWPNDLKEEVENLKKDIETIENLIENSEDLDKTLKKTKLNSTKKS